VPLDPATSRLFPLGHAGLFTAIKEAEAKVIAPGAAEFVVVGGLDSYFDEERLMQLELEQRLLTDGLQDAATPGEGAAFMLLASRNACRRYGLKPLAWISAVGVGMEPGHRYSVEPLHGNGLSGAVAQTFRERGNGARPIRLVMAGITGETIHGKEWGIAYLRNRESFAETVRLEHSAEYTGDAGASLAPIMLAVVAQGLDARNLEGPALLWAASDQAERGALVAEAS
jgi:3-oxoacyl-[acyl-carrier-protein] synthase-1